MEAARHCGRLGLPIQVNTLVAEETADDLPATAGQVTTAAAMGNALIDRLRRAGIAFTVVES